MIKSILGHSASVNFGTNLKLKEVRVNGELTTDPTIIKKGVDSLVNKLMPDNDEKDSALIKMQIAMIRGITFKNYDPFNSYRGTVVGSSFNTKEGTWHIQAGPTTNILDSNNTKAGLIIDVNEEKLPCGHNKIEATKIDYEY
jgi:hypothetical protein